MKLGFASDHAGYTLKEHLKSWAFKYGHTIHDFGTNDELISVDYPDFVHRAMSGRDKWERLILVCGSGIGMSISANHYSNIRCALVTSVRHVKLAREHNDANTIAIGQWLTDFTQAECYMKAFLETPFQGLRHKRRINKLDNKTSIIRHSNELRLVNLQIGTQIYANGSCSIHLGDTHLICSASLDRIDTNQTYASSSRSITSKYNILSCGTYLQTNKNRQRRYCLQMQQLIVNSLNQFIDVEVLNNYKIHIVCNVVNDDGNSFCASITGAWLALALSFKYKGLFASLTHQIAAVNVGMITDHSNNKLYTRSGLLLDLDYKEEHLANVVGELVVAYALKSPINNKPVVDIMKDELKIVTFRLIGASDISKIDLLELCSLSCRGCQSLMIAQRSALFSKE